MTEADVADMREVARTSGPGALELMCAWDERSDLPQDVLEYIARRGAS